MKAFSSFGLCLIAALAAGCTFDSSQLRALPDGAIEYPAGPDAGASGAGGTGKPPDAATAVGGSDGSAQTGGSRGLGGSGGRGDAGVPDASATQPDVPIGGSGGGAGGISGVTGTGGGTTISTGGTTSSSGGTIVSRGGTTGSMGGTVSTGGGTITGGAGGVGGGMAGTDAGVAGAGGGGNGGVLASVDANCGITTTNLTKQPADLLLVLDKTGSLTRAMDSADECPTGSTTCHQRWETLVSGLNAVLTSSSNEVNWGLELFNSDGSCGVAAPEVPITPGSAAAVQAYIATVTPGGSTPTRVAIQTAVTYLQTLTDTNGKYILLATDGEPNCGGAGRDGGGAGVTDVPGTATEIGLAYKAGFQVYVVGVGTETGNLNNFAIAGGTDHYYPALSSQALTDSLSAIVGRVARCTFSLGKAPPDPNNIVIEFNGDHSLRPPRDTTHTNGWDYASPSDTSIQVYGSWCDNVTNGTYTSTEVLMGCPIP